MSNINAQNITVTNLTVSYINGLPYIPNTNPCSNPCTNGYYIACNDCNYSGPDVCQCGISCDYVEPYIDPCDCYVPCNNSGGTGPQGPQGAQGAQGATGPQGATGSSYASSQISFYYDLESGADLSSNGKGPGFTVDTVTIDSIQQTVAFLYPSVNYFNENPTGNNPWQYTSLTLGVYSSSNSNIFYVMPHNGEISSISVNTLTWFSNDGLLDLVIATGTNSFYSANVSLTNFSTVTFPISAYTNIIVNKTFSAGDGISCIIKEVSGGWPNTTPIFSSTKGLINISVYVKFYN